MILFSTISAAVYLLVSVASRKFYSSAELEVERMPLAAYGNQTLTKEMLEPLP
ncbi:hypothetical protein [Daejeonella lutea]|uniref:Uncharacterized protein n=1 Tax=Daejeonella lutea TaxID=572036 RepID=A0A1T5A471_9SPHI|nr:hypothetical protein [Daejeonella lutea]SKB29774.1 hypothetical protein SAMN05661099_0305 [Daejeonella lutea]